MNLIELRKKAYGFFNILTEDTLQKDRSSVNIPKNLKPTDDRKVLLGVLKDKISFFSEDLLDITSRFNIEQTIAKSYINEFNSIILSFFKEKELELDLSISMDNNLDDLDLFLDKTIDKKSELFNKDDLKKLLYDNVYTIYYQDNNVDLKKRKYIEQNFIIDFFRKNIFSKTYKEFIKILKEEYIEDTIIKDSQVVYILKENISSELSINIENEEDIEW